MADAWQSRVELVRAAHAHYEEDEAVEAALLPAIGTCVVPHPQPKVGGSLPGRAANIDRGRAAGDQRLHDDYFADRPVFGSQLFRRRFRMSRQVFERLQQGVAAADESFNQRQDAAGVGGGCRRARRSQRR
ncbi:hypothetical protein PybrP1_012146 [[Pythium] brassicae (nom. inval.)]|nr:hypothetical protein PybrP1_012146 [[Pythium] brassicae (nom. inval.)]